MTVIKFITESQLQNLKVHHRWSQPWNPIAEHISSSSSMTDLYLVDTQFEFFL
jgi:hypothetical protein